MESRLTEEEVSEHGWGLRRLRWNAPAKTPCYFWRTSRGLVSRFHGERYASQSVRMDKGDTYDESLLIAIKMKHSGVWW